MNTGIPISVIVYRMVSCFREWLIGAAARNWDTTISFPFRKGRPSVSYAKGDMKGSIEAPFLSMYNNSNLRPHHGCHLRYFWVIHSVRNLLKLKRLFERSHCTWVGGADLELGGAGAGVRVAEEGDESGAQHMALVVVPGAVPVH